jgi:hypothetical protein
LIFLGESAQCANLGVRQTAERIFETDFIGVNKKLIDGNLMREYVHLENGNAEHAGNFQPDLPEVNYVYFGL